MVATPTLPDFFPRTDLLLLLTTTLFPSPPILSVYVFLLKHIQYFRIIDYICHGRLITVSSQSVEKVSFAPLTLLRYFLVEAIRKTSQKLSPGKYIHIWNAFLPSSILQSLFYLHNNTVYCMLASFVACARATLALGKMDCLVRQAGYYFPPIQATAFLFLQRINANNLYMEWGFTFHPYSRKNLHIFLLYLSYRILEAVKDQ